MIAYTTVADDTLVLFKGAGFFKGFTLLAPDGVTPVNITAGTGVCKFRRGYAGSVAFTATVAIVSGAAGTYSVTVAPADTAAATVTASGAGVWEQLYWDVLLTVSGDKYLAARGSCLFYPVASL